MSIKLFLAGAIALAGVAVPSAAPAQYYGNGGYNRYYGDHRGGYNRYERRNWRAERRIERRRERIARRHYYRSRFGRDRYGW